VFTDRIAQRVPVGTGRARGNVITAPSLANVSAGVRCTLASGDADGGTSRRILPFLEAQDG
jgi:hypothetical protein